MSELGAPQRGFRAALRWLAQGLLSLPTTAALALIAGWSYLMYWAVTLPGEDIESVNNLKNFVNDLGHAPLFGLWVLWMLPLLPRRGDWVAFGPKAWFGFLSLALAAARLPVGTGRRLARHHRPRSSIWLLTSPRPWATPRL